jgi:hypothetical protein
MPVMTLPSEERVAPKSVLRHRPIVTKQRTQEPPPVRRASRTTRSRTHAQPHTQAARSTQNQQKESADVDVPTWKRENKVCRAPVPSQSRLLPVAGGMMLAVILMLLAQVLVGWVGNTWNNVRYGYPRTYQVDAVVGHQDSALHPSHFIALNLHGQVEIIEFPGGDVSHAHVYVGPQLSGPGAELLPVTLRFVTPPHAHLPNMVVLVGDSRFVFVNAHGTFVSSVGSQP